MNRRNVIKNSLGLIASTSLLSGYSQGSAVNDGTTVKHNFSFCLNTSTIMKQDIGLIKEIKLAASLGYDSIEIWIRTLEKYLKEGGTTQEIKLLTEDLGIEISNAIGFAKWIVNNDTDREKAIEQIKYEMDLLSQISCKRIAAPPFGATKGTHIDLQEAASRFRAVVDLGQKMGVKPQLELWGFSQNLHLFGETLFVAAECGHSEAIILPDVYHLYRGGSPFEALEMINGSKIEMFHINDYPEGFERSEVTDAMRVMPGDGIAPMSQILKSLNNKGSKIILSLEIFNPDYWGMPAENAAKIGLEKMKNSVANAIL